MSVELEDVTKRFGHLAAVNRIHLEVREGDIWIGDRVVDRLLSRLRNVGIVFQNHALLPNMNVFDNVAFGRHPRPGRSPIHPPSRARRVSAVSANLGQADALAVVLTVVTRLVVPLYEKGFPVRAPRTT